MKAAILDLLRQGNYISGQKLGQITGTSRAAVWKHINSLRSEGYRINSVTGKGYCLIDSPDRLLPEEIKSGLQTRVLGHRIIYQREVSSTQDMARLAAANGAEEGTLAITEIQHGGRGRLGRSWASLPGGISFSLILKPDIKPAEALRIPLLAGMGVACAIEQITDCTARLKWPNDIIIANKKVCGILLEMSAELDRLNWVIIGIGINANCDQRSFPKELRDIATSIYIETGQKLSRVSLLQQILYEFESIYIEYNESGFEPLRQRWVTMSNTINNEVVITSPNEQILGIAIDIDSDGALLLKMKDGKTEKIIAGDLQLREAKAL